MVAFKDVAARLAVFFIYMNAKCVRSINGAWPWLTEGTVGAFDP